MIAQIRMATINRDEPEIVRPATLWDLCERWMRNLHLPDHQREHVWPENKRIAFVNDIRDGVKPEGLFLTYQAIADGDWRIYLNDGSQRLRSVYAYYKSPELWGDTHDDMEAVLRHCDVPVQHRVYETHEDAIKVFVRVNYGTPCLPYDFAKGIIVSMPDYSAIWKSILDRLHKSLGAAMTDGSSSYRTTNGADQKKYLRDDYGLFYRFLSGDMQLSDYRTGAGKLTPDDVESPSKTIESRLRECMLTYGHTEVTASLSQFERFIVGETSVIKQLWAEYVNDANKATLQGVTPLMFRWLLSLAIWARNNKVDRVRQIDFIRKLLPITEGGTRIIDPENPRSSPGFGLGKLGSLMRICYIVKSDIYTGASRRATQNRQNNKPGVHNAHRKPFVLHGDGPVVPVAGPMNLSMGTRAMDDEEE